MTKAYKRTGALATWTYLCIAAALVFFDPQYVFEPTWLLPITNGIFVTGAGLVIAVFAALAFARTGSPSILLLGCGNLAFALAAAFAGFVVGPYGANANVTVYNCGALLSALFHLAGALSPYPPLTSWLDRGTRTNKVMLAYSVVIGIDLVILFATVTNLTPLFFAQEAGPTSIRQFVLGSAIGIFAAAALLIAQKPHFKDTDFSYWYIRGLFLIAVGLYAFFIQRLVGSPLGWAGRIGNYLGSIFLIASVVSVQAKGEGVGVGAEWMRLIEEKQLVRQISIRVWLLLLTLVIAIPATGGVIWFAVRDIRDARETAYNSVRVLSSQIARQLEGMDREHENLLARLAQRPLIRAVDSRNCDPIIGHSTVLFPKYTTLGVRDRDGNPVCSFIPKPPGADVVREFPWFIDGLRNEKFTVGNAFLGKATGRWVSVLTYPLHDASGKVSGLLVMPRDLRSLQDKLLPALPDGAIVGVFDLEDKYVFRSVDPDKWIGKPLPPSQAASAKGRREETYSAKGVDGTQRLFSVSSVSTSGWRVFAGLPQQELLAPSRDRLTRTLFVIAALGVLVLVLAWHLAQAIARPIRALAAVAEANAHGEAGEYASVDGPAEVADMAQEFNHMLGERKRAEHELQDALKHLMFHVENTPLAVIEFNNRYQITKWSKNAETMFGWGADEVIGKAIEELRWVYQDEVDSVAKVSADMLSATNTSNLHVNRNYRKDGQIITCEWYNSALTDSSGNLVSVLSLVHDITERVQTENSLRSAEHEFRQLAEAMPQIVWITRADGWNIYFNRQWVEYTGLTLEESYGHGWNKPFHPDDQQRAWDAWQNAVTNNDTYSLECRLRRADGAYLWWLVRGVPILDEDGKIQKWFGTCTNIDEFKRAADALRQSDDRLRLATEMADVAVWEYDFAAGQMNRSANHDKLYGLAWQERWDIDTFLQATHPDDREMSHEAIQASVAPGGPDQYAFDFRAVWPDASEHWLWVKGRVANRDAAGRGVLVRGILVDITTRKRAEADLLESEAKFSAAFRSSPAMLALITQDGRFVEVNDAFCERAGYAREDIVGRSAPDIGFISATERDRVLADFEQGGSPAKPSEARMRRGDGSVIDLLFTVAHISLHNAPHRLATCVDVTDRKKAEAELRESERRYRTLFEKMTAGFVLFEAVRDEAGLPIDLVIVSANKGFEATTGLSAPNFIGKRLTQVLPGIEQDPADWIGVYGQIALSGESRMFEQYSVLLKKHYSVAAYQAQPGRCAVTFTDVTDRKLAELEIAELNRDLERRVRERTAQLEAANKELETFSYSASHDLRAPLRAIQGFTQIIARRHKDAFNDEARHYLDNIILASNRMTKLIDDLLTYSRLGRGGVRLERLPLGPVLANVTNVFDERIAEAGATVYVAADLPVVLGDSGLLRQVFTNLLDNALLYRRKEEPLRVDVTWRREDGACVVCVADNGIGIAPAQLEKIFVMFERLHSSEEYPGTGIGLALARKSAELMGGWVWAESGGRTGAAFHVKLNLGVLSDGFT